MVATTWNPADKDANITLVGGNLTTTNLTSGSNFEGVRATTFKSGGKFYVEYTILAISGAFSSNGNFVMGIANATQNITNTSLGSSNNGYGYYPWSGLSFIGGSAGTIQVDQTPGHVLSLAVDFTGNKIWTRANNGNWNNDVIGNQNPATGTGGVSIAPVTGSRTLAYFGQQGGSCTLNCGATAYTFTAPAGFGVWDVVPPSGGFAAFM